MFQTFFIFTPIFGEDEPILTNIFEMGWNYQLVCKWVCLKEMVLGLGKQQWHLRLETREPEMQHVTMWHWTPVLETSADSVCLLNGLGWVGLGENLSVRTLRNVYVLQAFFIPQTEDFVSIADESPKILGLEDGSEQETKCWPSIMKLVNFLVIMIGWLVMVYYYITHFFGSVFAPGFGEPWTVTFTSSPESMKNPFRAAVKTY